MSYETITVEQRDAVTLITLNRPKALNALNSKVLEELIDAFAAYQADDSQLCAVLTGSGDKTFAAGADIKEMSEKEAADFYLEDFFAPWTSEIVKKTRKPWIAHCERGLWSVMQRRRNSSRVIWSSRNEPLMAEVIVFEFCFSTPRIIMHRW